MGNEDAETRRENLRRLIERDFDGNQSAFARVYWQAIEPDKAPRPSYISDLIRPGSRKSFAEKAARNVERAAGLVRGELDLPNSRLRRDPGHVAALARELLAELDEVGHDSDLQRELLSAVREIKARHRRAPRRTG